MSLKSTLALTCLASSALILVGVILLSGRYTLTYTTLPTYATTLYTIVSTYLTCPYAVYVAIRYTLPSPRARPLVPSSLLVLVLITRRSCLYYAYLINHVSLI
jgi:hypothetical protein